MRTAPDDPLLALLLPHSTQPARGWVAPSLLAAPSRAAVAWQTALALCTHMLWSAAWFARPAILARRLLGWAAPSWAAPSWAAPSWAVLARRLFGGRPEDGAVAGTERRPVGAVTGTERRPVGAVAGTERRPVEDDSKHVDDDEEEEEDDDEDDGIEEVESRYTGRRAPGTESVPTVHASAHHGALFTDGTESVPTVHLTMVPKCARDGAEAVAQDGAEAVARDGAEAVAQDGAEAVAQDGAEAAAELSELSELSAVDFEVAVGRPLPAPPSSTSPSQLTLCMVSDTHGYEVQGGRMPAADVLVHCGDWCNRYESHPLKGSLGPALHASAHHGACSPQVRAPPAQREPGQAR